MEENQIDKKTLPETQECSACHTITYGAYYFCPMCGKQLRHKPLSTSFGKQLGIYLLSIFLPPLGLWPAFKYLQEKTPKSQIIAWVAILLTIISLAVTTYYALQIGSQMSQMLNSQLNLQTGGY